MSSITSLFPHPPIPHHIDASLFPMMDEAALNELAADIKISGLSKRSRSITLIGYWSMGATASAHVLLPASSRVTSVYPSDGYP